MQKLQEIEGIVEELRRICSNYKSIEKLVVYGSRARGEHKRTSDIDLCFFGELKQEEYSIREEIDDIMTHYSFDIVFYKMLEKESLKQSIIRDGIIIYEKEAIAWEAES